MDRRTKAMWETQEGIAWMDLQQRAYSMQEEERGETVQGSVRLNVPYQENVCYYVDGERVSQGKILQVAEECGYMADYVMGKEGRLSEIRLDRIDHS